MPWGPEGCIEAFNRLLRLPLYMGSAKSSAVPWQGAWFVVCLKLKLSKEAHECLERVFLFGFVLNPRFGPSVSDCHVQRGALLGFAAQVQTPLFIPAHAATLSSLCFLSLGGS